MLVIKGISIQRTTNTPDEPMKDAIEARSDQVVEIMDLLDGYEHESYGAIHWLYAETPTEVDHEDVHYNPALSKHQILFSFRFEKVDPRLVIPVQIAFETEPKVAAGFVKRQIDNYPPPQRSDG
jgi:hypothetical protein